jgi:hypothetical protein
MLSETNADPQRLCVQILVHCNGLSNIEQYLFLQFGTYLCGPKCWRNVLVNNLKVLEKCWKNVWEVTQNRHILLLLRECVDMVWYVLCHKSRYEKTVTAQHC